MLSPAGAKHRHPFGRVERADGQPTRYWNRVGLLNKRFQIIDWRGEPQIAGNQGFHGHNPLHAAIQV